MLHRSNTLCETLPILRGGCVPVVLLCTFCNNSTVAMGSFLSVSNGLMAEAAFGGPGFRGSRRACQKQQELMPALLH